MTAEGRRLDVETHLHALRAASAEVDRALGNDAAEVPARSAQSPISSAGPMSAAISGLERRIAGIDREMLSCEMRRRAARDRWELSSADFYANAQSKLLAYRRELEALIERAKKL